MAFREAANALLDELGMDEYTTLLLRLAEAYEVDLRQNDPDNPILDVLDEHRRQQDLGLNM